MCAFVPIALAAMTVAQMAMQKQQADNQSNMYKYEGAVAQTKGALTANDQQQQMQLLLGKQRAAFGASGVDPNSGSADDVYAQTGKDSAHNIFQTNFNTSNQVTSDNMSAANSIFAGNQAMAGTALNYGSRMAMRYS